MWRQTTRYEIPCRVTGTVRVGDESIRFGGPGQRDHSWGSRDWWTFDWMWSALHLEDGTHTHAVAIPQLPGFGVGYVQQGDAIAEISSVEATEKLSDDGLIETARIVSEPDGLDVEMEPLGFGRAAGSRLPMADCRCSRARCVACERTTTGPAPAGSSGIACSAIPNGFLKPVGCGEGWGPTGVGRFREPSGSTNAMPYLGRGKELI